MIDPLTGPVLRPIAPQDVAAVLELNALNVRALSDMDEDRLIQLHGWADRVDVIDVEGEVAGFVITFAPDTDYDSLNYRAFGERYASDFYYLDRIAIADPYRRRGLASFVYDELERVYSLNGYFDSEDSRYDEIIRDSALAGTIPMGTNLRTMREKGHVRFIDWGLAPMGLSQASPLSPNKTHVPFRDHTEAGDPFPTYAWLREQSPVHWDAKNGAWIVSRYEDVVYVSKNPKLFCSGQGVMVDADMQISIVTMDDPRHSQLRSLISRGFTPRMVQRLDERVREITTACIDAVAARGACDFAQDLAVPLPLLVIAEMIGIRHEDRAQFAQWSDTMILAAGQQANLEILEKASNAFAEYATYLQDVFAERRRNPREDLVSTLLAAESDGKLATDGENISADELLQFMTLLLVAGNETTRNTISGGLVALAQNPDQWARLVADRSLVTSAVEEILRWSTAVIYFMRTATKDTTLGGVEIAAGDPVVMVYASANRDETEFGPTAGEFDIGRTPNRHLAFGFGAHFCLGAALARLEITAVLECLLDRGVTRLEPAGPVGRTHDSTAVAPTQRTVRFEGASNCVPAKSTTSFEVAETP